MDSVLCAANAQSMLYWFNEERYKKIPELIKNDLKKICVSYCADVGGVIIMCFNDKHELNIQTISPIDEIGAELKIKQMRADNETLFHQLERFEKEFPC